MRVLAVVHQFVPDFQTGTERLCLMTMQALANKGHATSVLTADPLRQWTHPAREARVEGVETIYVPTGGWRSGDVVSRMKFYTAGRNAEAVADRAKRWRPDIIHIHHVSQFGLRTIGRLARIAPVIFSATDFHLICPYATALLADGAACSGPDPSDANCLAHHRLRPQHHGLRAVALTARLADVARRVYESPRDARAIAAVAAARRDRVAAFSAASLVIAGSERMRAMFLAAGAPPQTLVLIPHEAPPLDPPHRALEAPLRLGFHGTLSAHKGAHVFLAALRALPRSLPFKAIVQGDMKTDPGYVAELKTLAQGDARIEFRPAVPFEMYAASLAEIDVLVVPSIWAENRPLTLLSAIENGRFVVGSRVPGIEAALADRSYGRLVPPDDPAALADCLKELVADPAPVVSAREAQRKPTRFLAYVDTLEALYRRFIWA